MHSLLFPDSDREYLTGGSKTHSPPAYLTDDEEECTAEDSEIMKNINSLLDSGKT
jgi:hypothetical protein